MDVLKEVKITNNQEALRFETYIGDELGYVEYRWYKGNLALIHTFVPKQGRGKGFSAALAKFALEYAKENKLQIMVYCTFIAKYIKEHPEYKYLKNKEFHKG